MAILWAFLMLLAACCCNAAVSALTATPMSVSVWNWNQVALQSIAETHLGAPESARALAILNTCMYDAWSAYDERATGTELKDALRRPMVERTEANKREAISYAAFRALADLFPASPERVYKPMMRELGYDPENRSIDIEVPAGIGNVACAAVLEFRHRDRANQLGEMNTSDPHSGPYDDWSGYKSTNSPTTVPIRISGANIIDPNHWQPLVYTDSNGSVVVQRFHDVQWCFVAPFAMAKGDEYRPVLQPGPYRYGTPEYERQAEEMVDISAQLSDRQKMVTEYWSDGQNTAGPSGHWIRFAEIVSARDHHTLDDDVKMFFVLSNALLDAGIAAWDAKRTWDSVRPVTAVELLYQGKPIRAWGGPGKGTVEMDGSKWIPYEPASSPTPPFPDFVSGHSTFSAAAARILELWTGSNRFDYSVTLTAGSSKIEPGLTPARTITLRWATFAEAADEAGMSRRYGGIHFPLADVKGRELGRLVAERAWTKAHAYFDGAKTESVAITQNR